MKISTPSGYVLLSLTALCSQAAFGMEALQEKQVSVARQMQQEKERQRESAEQAEEQARKRQQAEKEEKDKEEQRKKAEKAEEAQTKCKPAKKVGEEKIPGTKDALTSSWVIKAAYADLYPLFGVKVDVDNKTLQQERTVKSLQERIAAIIAHFQTQKEAAEGQCADDFKSAVDWAIERVQGFHDFLTQVRGADLKADGLKNKLLEYQNKWAEASTALAEGRTTVGDKPATDLQRDMAFRVELIKEYAKNPLLGLRIPDKKFINEFDISAKEVSTSSNLDVAVKALEAEVGDLQNAIRKDIDNSTLNGDKKAYLAQLSIKETKVKAALANYTSEDDQGALNVLLNVQIPALRKKLEAAK